MNPMTYWRMAATPAGVKRQTGETVKESMFVYRAAERSRRAATFDGGNRTCAPTTLTAAFLKDAIAISKPGGRATGGKRRLAPGPRGAGKGSQSHRRICGALRRLRVPVCAAPVIAAHRICRRPGAGDSSGGMAESAELSRRWRSTSLGPGDRASQG